MMVYISTKFHENILGGIKVIEQTRFSSEKFQSGIIPWKWRWNIGSCSLHIVWWWFIFILSFMKISWTVSVLWSGHEKLTDIQTDRRMSGQTDRRTDGGHDIIRPVFDRHMKTVVIIIYFIRNLIMLLPFTRGIFECKSSEMRINLQSESYKSDCSLRFSIVFLWYFSTVRIVHIHL